MTTITTCPHCAWERAAPTPAYARRITADHMAREHKPPAGHGHTPTEHTDRQMAEAKGASDE